jgi:hypothetical protein
MWREDAPAHRRLRKSGKEMAMTVPKRIDAIEPGGKAEHAGDSACHRRRVPVAISIIES